MTPEIAPYKDGKYILKNVRVTFTDIAKPQETENGPKYGLTVLLPQTPEGTEVKKKLAKVCQMAVEAKWPNDEKRPRKLISPIKDSADGEACEDGVPAAEKWDGYEGHWYIRMSTNFQPGVVGPNGKPLPASELEEEIYGGCWCSVLVHTYAYSNKKHGVSFGLDAVQKVKDGESFGGKIDAASVFGALEGATDDNPFGDTTGDDDDEPPF